VKLIELKYCSIAIPWLTCVACCCLARAHGFEP